MRPRHHYHWVSDGLSHHFVIPAGMRSGRRCFHRFHSHLKIHLWLFGSCWSNHWLFSGVSRRHYRFVIKIWLTCHFLKRKEGSLVKCYDFLSWNASIEQGDGRGDRLYWLLHHWIVIQSRKHLLGSIDLRLQWERKLDLRIIPNKWHCSGTNRPRKSRYRRLFILDIWLVDLDKRLVELRHHLWSFVSVDVLVITEWFHRLVPV